MTPPGPTITVKAPPGTRVNMRVVEDLLAQHKCPDCTPTRVVAEFDPAVNPDPDAAAGWTVTTWHATGCPGLTLRLLAEAQE